MLVDAGTQGMQRLHDIATKGLLATSRLVTVAEVTGFENADIEDVSSIGDYRKLSTVLLGRTSRQRPCRLIPADRGGH